MDIIAAKLGANMAMSELAANGQIGSSTKLVYTYNGDPSKVIEIMGVTFVKLSDAAHDLSSIAVVKVHCEGKEITAFASELVHDTYDGVPTVSVPISDNSTWGAISYIPYDVAAMLDVPTGLYFSVDLEGDYYPTYIEFAETIKPIDPKYLPEGSVGSDTRKIYTFDGNTEGLEVINNDGLTGVKISDETPDLHEIESITIYAYIEGQYGESQTYDSTRFTVVEANAENNLLFGGTGLIIFTTEGNMPVALTVTKSDLLHTGLYVFCNNKEGATSGMYVTEVNFGGELKTIDPKYITTILDLTQIECSSDGEAMTYNDALVSVFSQAAMAGGALQTVQFSDGNHKLRTAATGKANLVMRVTMPEAVIDYPLMVANDEDGVAQLAFTGLMAVPGLGVAELKVYLQLYPSYTVIGMKVDVVGA